MSATDLAGLVIGSWTVVRMITGASPVRGRRCWVRCECGFEREMLAHRLTGHVPSMSCGCRKRTPDAHSIRTLDDLLAWCVPIPDTGCFLWPSGSAEEYGVTRTGSRRHGNHRVVATHRLAWEFAYGPVPDGLWVLHRCDTRPCSTPTHLFLGDHAANMADMAAKGRAVTARGAEHRLAKLSDEAVSAMRARHAAGASQRALSSEFGVAPSRVSLIVRGLAWRAAS